MTASPQTRFKCRCAQHLKLLALIIKRCGRLERTGLRPAVHILHAAHIEAGLVVFWRAGQRFFDFFAAEGMVEEHGPVQTGDEIGQI